MDQEAENLHQHHKTKGYFSNIETVTRVTRHQSSLYLEYSTFSSMVQDHRI